LLRYTQRPPCLLLADCAGASLAALAPNPDPVLTKTRKRLDELLALLASLRERVRAWG
jgi:hypothetical protein